MGPTFRAGPRQTLGKFDATLMPAERRRRMQVTSSSVKVKALVKVVLAAAVVVDVADHDPDLQNLRDETSVRAMVDDEVSRGRHRETDADLGRRGMKWMRFDHHRMIGALMWWYVVCDA
jgi:hypothetical protein